MTTQLASTAEQVRPILERYGVKKAGVFGSFVRGEASPESDLDLVVEMPPGSSLLELVGLQQEISDLLGIEVDAGTYQALHPQLRDRILAEEVRILGA
jgi:predicted nucleotidyltransferase